ncbi:tRNA(His) 5'-end guanylyltransferase [Methanomicrobium sp. W14]|jgi:tRNA(His) guanylyltransferase|uniref:tRNA(His) guanylyltransferase Thg1 family protein n=1 Tax=Methanomicrobium sp. W14 TaxID=2817839 RepID=UPI001AE5E8E9|nr:tRNA(His) guanylyltransferase Thg1 family protein [Methanomicrobium sp. W14]MBP2133043.1 tRNA(His) 5'-end guanylyltransferase [Methanomicrobium sp. W14]
MQNREIFSCLSIVPPVVVRLDGRSFHGLTAGIKLEKPYDSGFNDAMCTVCEYILSKSGLDPDFAYTFSDEISLFFSVLPFNGRIEKIDSVCAAYASSAFTLLMGLDEPVSFDSRVVVLGRENICEYFSWRQKEAWRNHMNAYCQHALIAEGMTPVQAARRLKGMKSAAMHEMMHEREINLSKTPSWQRRGVVVHKETYMKTGYNPVEKTEVKAQRKRVVRDLSVPLFSEPDGEDYLYRLISNLS